jgi:hypothetical protein
MMRFIERSLAEGIVGGKLQEVGSPMLVLPDAQEQLDMRRSCTPVGDRHRQVTHPAGQDRDEIALSIRRKYIKVYVRRFPVRGM